MYLFISIRIRDHSISDDPHGTNKSRSKRSNSGQVPQENNQLPYSFLDLKKVGSWRNTLACVIFPSQEFSLENSGIEIEI